MDALPPGAPKLEEILINSDAMPWREKSLKGVSEKMLWRNPETGASIALILVVSAEMIGANTGVGALLLASGNLMQTERLMAAIVAISTLGLLIGALISWLERLLLGWR